MRPKQASQRAWPQGRATTGSAVSKQTGQWADAKTLFPQARRGGRVRQMGQARGPGILAGHRSTGRGLRVPLDYYSPCMQIFGLP